MTGIRGGLCVIVLTAACAAESAPEELATVAGTGGGAAQSGNTGSGGSGAATTSSSSSGSGAGSAAEVKVAFIGDSEYGGPFASVLQLILNEGADMIVHNGDFDYENDPVGFYSFVDSKIGSDFPYFTSIGNHDAPEWGTYAQYQSLRFDTLGVTPDDPDLDDEKYDVTFEGLHLVFVGENGNNDEFAQYILDRFDSRADEWKICGWHKNMNAMQIGGKTDEMSWPIYENCIAEGAIITTAHEHSYERTKTLTSAQTQTVDATCADRNAVCVGPGRSFAFVSGLGGASVRDQERCLPSSYPYGCKQEWAFIYASNQNATYGALFMVFNAGGDTKKAHGYFKNVNGSIVEEFDVTRD